MTDDMHELMRTALLEPDGDPPVEELIRRGRTRRTRRRAALVVVPVLALVAGLLAVPGLFDERVQLAPAEPGAAASGGWPVQVRYELVDLHYVETGRLPAWGGQSVPLQTWEFAGSSWDDWYAAIVGQYGLDSNGWPAPPDGSPRAALGHPLPHTGEIAGARRYVGGVGMSLPLGQEVPAHPDQPFATIRALMDPGLEWDDRLPVPMDGPLASESVFGPVAVDYRSLPAVRVLDERFHEPYADDFEQLRRAVGGALGLDPDDLSAVVYDEPLCFDPYAEGEACAEREDAEWVRWARVWHTATQIPLYVHWAEADSEDNPDALQVTMLRVTHIDVHAEGEPVQSYVTGGEIHVVASNLAYIDPPEHPIVTQDWSVELSNEGSVVHTLVSDELGIDLVAEPNDRAWWGPEDVQPGRYTVYCRIPGHRQAGMEFVLEVTD